MSHEKDSLLNQAMSLHRDASALLTKSNLISVLEEFGQIYMTGSFHHGLMTNPDIDLYLTSPHASREQAKEVLNRLIDQGFWNAYFFGDWVRFRVPDLPEGYYIGLKHTFHRKRWKVDIWSLPCVPEEQVQLNRMLENSLTDTNRLLILEIKQWRDTSKLDISSTLIYEAVLSGRAKDIESFQKMIRLT